MVATPKSCQSFGDAASSTIGVEDLRHCPLMKVTSSINFIKPTSITSILSIDSEKQKRVRAGRKRARHPHTQQQQQQQRQDPSVVPDITNFEHFPVLKGDSTTVPVVTTPRSVALAISEPKTTRAQWKIDVTKDQQGFTKYVIKDLAAPLPKSTQRVTAQPLSPLNFMGALLQSTTKKYGFFRTLNSVVKLVRPSYTSTASPSATPLRPATVTPVPKQPVVKVPRAASLTNSYSIVRKFTERFQLGKMFASAVSNAKTNIVNAVKSTISRTVDTVTSWFRSLVPSRAPARKQIPLERANLYPTWHRLSNWNAVVLSVPTGIKHTKTVQKARKPSASSSSASYASRYAPNFVTKIWKKVSMIVA